MIRFFRREKVIILLVWVIVFCGGAEITFGGRGGQPSAFTHSVLPFEYVEQVVTEAIDVEAVRLEDEQREAEGLPYRFAIGHPVSITPETAGTWEELDGGMLLWRLEVTSPGALTLNLGFGRYRMPDGGRLFIYTVDHNDVLGAYTEEDNEEHGQLWTPVIHSDDIVVEVMVPSPAVDELELELVAINEGYRGFRSIDKGLGDSGSCNINVACPEGDGWRDQIRSVAMLTVTGVSQCSGVLVNNTSKDWRPYFLTANHCGIDAGNAGSIVVYWKYEASTCGGTTAPLSYNQTGSILRANYSASDFSLVELDDMPLFDVYYAGWDIASAAPSSGVSIHHPSGDMKKISFENDPLSITSYGGSSSPGDGTHLRVADWDVGTTEGGSSGCPIFNPGKRIVGQLHGGYAACGNNLADWYGRFYVSWTGDGTPSGRLSDWLDPLGLGVTYLDGDDPNHEFFCTATEDFETGDFSSFPWIRSGNANWTITSSDKHAGIYSAKAGTIGHNQSTSLEVTLDCAAGGIKFYLKVSSESGYDYLKFYIDEDLKGSWSGTQNWAEVIYPVSAGSRTFRWTYSKDGSVSSGSDTAWIDDIAFPIICGDFDADGDVDFGDYSILADYWLTDEFLVDIAPAPAGDGIVDEQDLDVLCDNWLAGVE